MGKAQRLAGQVPEGDLDAGHRRHHVAGQRAVEDVVRGASSSRACRH